MKIHKFLFNLNLIIYFLATLILKLYYHCEIIIKSQLLKICKFMIIILKIYFFIAINKINPLHS